MDDSLALEIGRKLDTLVKLLAIFTVENKRPKDQYSVLSRAGLRPKEIAELLGTTPNTVSVELSKLRKEGRLRLGTVREARDD